MSIPPPAGARAARPPSSPSQDRPDAGRRREIRLELRAARGLRRAAGWIRLTGSELVLFEPGVLREPLTVPGGLVEVAAVEREVGRRDQEHGRFPILRRTGASTVAPLDQGCEGWLWTPRSGSALPILCDDDGAAPNVALAFARPLAEAEVVRCFEPGWLRRLAERSPLGRPSIPGLLIVAADPAAAEEGLARFGVLGPITDREIPPSMRRHLPSDKPANRPIPAGHDRRAANSVAPPGVR